MKISKLSPELPSFLSIITYIIPAVAFAVDVSYLGEDAAPCRFLGLAGVLIGIAMTHNRPRMRKPEHG